MGQVRALGLGGDELAVGGSGGSRGGKGGFGGGGGGSAGVPKAESVQALLEQALLSDDRSLLEECLSISNQRVIQVCAYPSPPPSPLLATHISRCMYVFMCVYTHVRTERARALRLHILRESV